MSDYISRQTVMKEFADFVRRANNSDFAPTPTWNDAVSLVGSTPPADVAPVVHGRWKAFAGDDLIIDYICSSCGETSEFEFSFCPNCGADMRGDADE